MWISPKFHLVVLRAFLEMYEQPQLEEPKATPAQKQTIKNAVHQATIRTGRTHQNIWNVAHTQFGINEIAELKAKDYYRYLDFVENMQPKALPNPTNQLTIPNAGRWFVVVDDFGNVTHIKNLEGKSIISTDIYRKLRADARATADILYEIAHRMEVVDGQCSLEQFNTPILNIANFNL